MKHIRRQKEVLEFPITSLRALKQLKHVVPLNSLLKSLLRLPWKLNIRTKRMQDYSTQQPWKVKAKSSWAEGSYCFPFLGILIFHLFGMPISPFLVSLSSLFVGIHTFSCFGKLWFPMIGQKFPSELSTKQYKASRPVEETIRLARHSQHPASAGTIVLAR